MGDMLASMAAFAPHDPIIRERVAGETPMAFSYGADETANDGSDSELTASREALSVEDAEAILGEPREPRESGESRESGLNDAAGTQELSADDVLEACEPLIPDDAATLESLPDAPTTETRVPVAPDSTPTLPAPSTTRSASHAPSASPTSKVATRALVLAVAPSSRPASRPPSTLPTVIAPKSLGMPSRRHVDVHADRESALPSTAPEATPLAVYAASAFAEARAIPSTRRSTPADPLDLLVSPRLAATPAPAPVVAAVVLAAPKPPSEKPAAPPPARPLIKSPPSAVPETRPYPPQESAEDVPPATPASLPIPLRRPTKPSTSSAATRAVEAAMASEAFDSIDAPSQPLPLVPVPLVPVHALPPPSTPVPLGRLIEASIAIDLVRPTLSSAHPLQVEAPPPPVPVAPMSAVKPMVLVDMSAAYPTAAALRAAERRTSVMAWAFVAFAAVVAAALSCIGIFALRSNAATGATSSQPPSARIARHTGRARDAEQPFRPSQSTSAPIGASGASGASATVPSVSGTSGISGDRRMMSDDASRGIPVLAVDSLPKVANKRGVLHIDSQYDGHRIFVDGAVVGSGGGDYELVCGTHGIRIGSHDRMRIVNVPCGGETGI